MNNILKEITQTIPIERNCMTPDQQLLALLSTQSKRFSMKKRQRKQKAKLSVKKSLNFDNARQNKNANRDEEQKNMNTNQQSRNSGINSLDQFSSEEDSYGNEDSNGICMKRVRKNRDQIKALHIAFEQAEGNWTKEDQMALARQLGLSEQQVYKWSWDQMQKRRKVDQYQNSSEYAFLRQPNNTDEFGGYSKTWLSKGGMSSATERKYSDDFDGIDSISTLIGIDIEQKAKDIVAKKSPDGYSKRQIAKPINPNPFSIIPEFKRPNDLQSAATRKNNRSCINSDNALINSSEQPVKKSSSKDVLSPAIKNGQIAQKNSLFRDLSIPLLSLIKQSSKQQYIETLNSFSATSTMEDNAIKQNPESAEKELENIQKQIQPLLKKTLEYNQEQNTFNQGFSITKSMLNKLSLSNKSTPQQSANKPMIVSDMSIKEFINNAVIATPFQFRYSQSLQQKMIEKCNKQDEQMNKSIMTAAQSLFDDLPINDEDEIEDSRHMSVPSMQKQGSIKQYNSLISPMSFLNPAQQMQQQIQRQQTSMTNLPNIHDTPRQNLPQIGQNFKLPYQQTPFNILNSALSNKLFALSPSPNLRKPFVFQ